MAEKRLTMAEKAGVIARQATDTASSALKNQIGKEHRATVAQEALAARKRDVGAQDLDSFKLQMILKHGNMHRAWVKALDVSGNGKISKVEFFNAARAAGYVADVRKLWEWCDSDGSGFVTINELAEEEAELMKTFKDTLKQKYGNLYAGWVYLLDEDKSGRLTAVEIEAACEKLGVPSECTDPFSGRTFKLFDLLDVGKTGFVHLEQVDAKAGAAVLRGEAQLLLAQARDGDPNLTREEKRDVGMVGSTEASHRSTLLVKLERMQKDAERAKLRSMDRGAKTLDEFLWILKARFRTLVRAWRTVLDEYEIGRLSFAQFCKSCRVMGYQGPVKTLWTELDGHVTGFIELHHIDPDSHNALRQFQMVLHKHESVESAWHNVLDVKKKHRLDRGDIVEAMERIGYLADCDVLWEALDLDGGGFITVDEINFLWTWAADVRMDTWRAVLKQKTAAQARKRNRRAALRLPILPPKPPPLSDEVLQTVEPLLRSTLSMLPDLSESSIRSSSSVPGGLGASARSQSGGVNLSLTNTSTLAARSRGRSVGPPASPQFVPTFHGTWTRIQ
jgi:hypothetical protein